MQKAHTAKNKMMDTLATRPHSERELREKIANPDFAPEEIEAAIEYARSRNWLKSAEETGQDMAEILDKKGKGSQLINAKLAEKGLPELIENPQHELEKAKRALDTKFKSNSNRGINPTDHAKRARFLAGRGFSEEIIEKTIGPWLTSDPED